MSTLTAAGGDSDADAWGAADALPPAAVAEPLGLAAGGVVAEVAALTDAAGVAGAAFDWANASE